MIQSRFSGRQRLEKQLEINEVEWKFGYCSQDKRNRNRISMFNIMTQAYSAFSENLDECIKKGTKT